MFIEVPPEGSALDAQTSQSGNKVHDPTKNKQAEPACAELCHVAHDAIAVTSRRAHSSSDTLNGAFVSGG
jgi:hypothetical protein